MENTVAERLDLLIDEAYRVLPYPPTYFVLGSALYDTLLMWSVQYIPLAFYSDVRKKQYKGIPILIAPDDHTLTMVFKEWSDAKDILYYRERPVILR